MNRGSFFFFFGKFLLQGGQACVEICSIDRDEISQRQDRKQVRHFVDVSRKTADHYR